MDAFATLSRRGFVKQTTDAEALNRLLDAGPVAFYLGIDPTGPSLHAGHLVGLLAMAHLQRAGHRPVLLIGGATARVGDPSDKDEMRPLLPLETVARNAELMQRQVGRFIDLELYSLVFWLIGALPLAAALLMLTVPIRKLKHPGAGVSPEEDAG